jgi:hypothetical protein
MQWRMMEDGEWRIEWSVGDGGWGMEGERYAHPSSLAGHILYFTFHPITFGIKGI